MQKKKRSQQREAGTLPQCYPAAERHSNHVYEKDQRSRFCHRFQFNKTTEKVANIGVRRPHLICSSHLSSWQTGSTLLHWAGAPFPRLQTDLTHPQRSVCPPSYVLMLPVPASSCLFRMREGWRRDDGAVIRQENVRKKALLKGLFKKSAPNQQ